MAAIQFERKEKQAALDAVKLSQKYEISEKGAKWIFYSNLNLLGSIYRDLEEWQKAIDVLEETITLAKQGDNQVEMYSALKNLGDLYFRKGDFRKAINAFNQFRQYDYVGIDRANISYN